MAKTKISEFSSTPANNTDIDSINIAEGCAPSGINDAIRELMAQLKDFQTGAQGDSFNGPIGTSTAAAGAFTTLSATGAITSTLATGTAPLVIASTTKVANLNVDLLDGADWASPAALGSTTPAAVSATTLAASSTVTLSGGTANGVAYLNGSKVVTSGSALTFNGTNLTFGSTGQRITGDFSTGTDANRLSFQSSTTNGFTQINAIPNGTSQVSGFTAFNNSDLTNAAYLRILPSGTEARFQSGITGTGTYLPLTMYTGGGERLRIDTSGNVGIGTSSPTNKLDILTGDNTGLSVRSTNYSGSFGPSGLGGMALTAAGAYPLFFYINGATRATLDSSGNLGLGVTPSAWGSGYKAIQLLTSALYGTTSRDMNLGANVYVDAVGYKYIQTSFATNYTQYQGAHSWFTAPSGTAGNAITFTQAMTLTGAGRLGIGTTSPAVSLDVAGGSSADVITIRGRTSDNFGLLSFATSAGTKNAYIGSTDSTNLVFYTNGFNERARIDSSGNLLVGTTSALSSLSGSSQVKVGGSGMQNISQAISAATPTTIAKSGSGGVAIVGGYNGTGQYSAIVLFKYGGTTTSVIGALNDTGSTITYAISGTDLQVTSSLALTNLTVTCIRTA